MEGNQSQGQARCQGHREGRRRRPCCAAHINSPAAAADGDRHSAPRCVFKEYCLDNSLVKHIILQSNPSPSTQRTLERQPFSSDINLTWRCICRAGEILCCTGAGELIRGCVCVCVWRGRWRVVAVKSGLILAGPPPQTQALFHTGAGYNDCWLYMEHTPSLITLSAVMGFLRIKIQMRRVFVIVSKVKL